MSHAIGFLSPARALGAEISPVFEEAPSFSFGGGALLGDELQRRREEIARATRLAEVQRSELLKLERRRRARKAARAPVSRGFGSAERLQTRGGPLELPESPGPAQYVVPRHHDTAPEWSASSRTPWGKRTEPRRGGASHLPTAAGDVGPGEYTAQHAFSGTQRPCAKFGLPRREPTRGPHPDPTAYTPHATSIGTAQAFSMGTGEQSASRPVPPGPGPAQYFGERRVAPRPPHADFGSSTLVQHPHPADEVDPLGPPPGPGQYEVATSWGEASPGGAIGRRLETVEGTFHALSPAPDAYSPKPLRGSCGMPMSRVKREVADPSPAPDPNSPQGPGDYSPSFEAASAVASPPRPLIGGKNRLGAEQTNKRSRKELLHEEMVEAMKAKGYLKPKPRPFVPAGPQWSLGRYRVPTWLKIPGEMREEMLTSVSSFG